MTLCLYRWSAEDREAFERFTATLTDLQARVRAASGHDTGVPVPRGPRRPSLMERAQALRDHRRHRAAVAGELAELFADPAWDLLLALYISGGRTTASALAAGAGVADRLAGRWVGALGARDLVWSDGGDVVLTDQGRSFLTRYLDSL
ncbi:hypothetical protein [Sphingomonas sp.]|uniref:hypothetical protein n=1 Tax=Sphingomonas sp. TaxID=28214 RepID=UPI0035AE7698